MRTRFKQRVVPCSHDGKPRSRPNSSHGFSYIAIARPAFVRGGDPNTKASQVPFHSFVARNSHWWVVKGVGEKHTCRLFLQKFGLSIAGSVNKSLRALDQLHSTNKGVARRWRPRLCLLVTSDLRASRLLAQLRCCSTLSLSAQNLLLLCSSTSHVQPPARDIPSQHGGLSLWSPEFGSQLL